MFKKLYVVYKKLFKCISKIITYKYYQTIRKMFLTVVKSLLYFMKLSKYS